MHELGIVMEIFELLDEIVQEQKLQSVHSITIEAGELCGIIPEYFSECWKVARLGGAYESTEMKLIVIPALARCSCGNEYELNTCSRICPECHKTDYEIIGGRDFELKEIEAI